MGHTTTIPPKLIHTIIMQRKQRRIEYAARNSTQLNRHVHEARVPLDRSQGTARHISLSQTAKFSRRVRKFHQSSRVIFSNESHMIWQNIFVRSNDKTTQPPLSRPICFDDERQQKRRSQKKKKNGKCKT